MAEGRVHAPTPDITLTQKRTIRIRLSFDTLRTVRSVLVLRKLVGLAIR